MTHDIGAAVEVHASAGLSLAAKGETNCCERLRNRAESEVLKGAQTLFPRGNAELQPCRLAVCMVTSRQWRVPSDKERNLLARCGHRNKNAMVYPSSGSFYRAFACGATLLVCAASAQADGTPSRPARWNSTPEIDGSWRDIRSILGCISSSRNPQFPQSANCDFRV